MVDACESEQTSLLRAYVLAADKVAELSKLTEREDSAAGPCSISPFVPCAPSRIPYILQASRLTADDVLYDLGCGDGVILHEAAQRIGCRCVGLDIDAPCIAMARAKAADMGVSHLCSWIRCDLMRLLPGALCGGSLALEGALADVRDIEDKPLPKPTVALAFVTGMGLVRLGPWLHGEWTTAPQGLRLVTCVESLDVAYDHTDVNSMFADANELGWMVCRDFARWGVFVVPPRDVGVDAWSARGSPPLRLTRREAEATSPIVLPGLLSQESIGRLCELGEARLAAEGTGGGGAGGECISLFDLPDELSFYAAGETALHCLPEHRVVYLHGDARSADEVSCLPALEMQLVAAMREHDSWGLLARREVNVRSLEYHEYSDGGSVMDPEHRDDGSLLSLSVLLSPLEDFEGGVFATFQAEVRKDHVLGPGDGVLFVSEKRHNVSAVRGKRRVLVLELWEGPRNTRNRHA